MKKLILLCLSCCVLYANENASKTKSIPTQNINSILFIGDSLTDGYGIDRNFSYPSILKNKIKEELKRDMKILNGSVSGSTTASAMERFKFYLKTSRPDMLFLALGANDGLRGISVENSKQNLVNVVALARKNNISVVLAGMLLPPNYGQKYRDEFAKMYKEIAGKHEVIFIPFLLEGVAGEKKYNLTDGIHPNEKGHAMMADHVFKYIKDKL